MPDDPRGGLFFPGQAAAAPRGAAEQAAPDPSVQAAAAAQARAATRRHSFDRRLAIRWAGWGSVLAILGGWTNGFLGFFYPNKTGAFGGTITAATVSELKVGEVKVISDGKFYLVRLAEGFVALWWKCPHLGCTVPWKDSEPPLRGDEQFSKGQFHCPCHGSQYNRYGQIIAGPAPRPMDAFPVTIDGDKVKVETGPTKAITRSDNSQAGPGAKAITKV
jgi:cytochrome b6-f complex iron-sulfur subunit